MAYNISIIGSSIAGASAANYLAKDNNVTIIEKKPNFKKTCSGIVTHVIDQYEKVPNNIIVNKANIIRINAPNKQFIEVKLKNPDYIYDREKLNEYFTHQAIDKGANLLQPAKFLRLLNKEIEISQNNEINKIKTDILIGADGSQSIVAKQTHLDQKRKFFLGVKAYIKMDHDNAIDVYPNDGLFSWVVPHQDNIVELGSFIYLDQKKLFDEFLKKLKIKNNQILSKEAALIPIYNPQQIMETKINQIKTYLIGDAATAVKATTGGSIFQSIKSAKILSNSIKNNQNYSKNWKKHMKRDLYIHLKIRNILDKLNEEDWNNLINKFQKPKLKGVLEKISRDNPTILALKLFLNDPSLILYSKFLF